VDLVLWQWVDLLVRWTHVIAGIAWIGSSFYFVHLDSSIKRRDGLPPEAGGEAWQVHGGGFYHMVKYLVAPARMPDELTWFKWEAYATWMSGFALLVIVYYFGASLYMIDPAVLALPVWAAVAISVLGIALGWVAYNAMCRSPLGRDDVKLAAAGFVFLVVLAYVFTWIFSGRGAYMQMGALIGTMMAANVLMIIIPNQKKVVADLIAGRTPDPALGEVAKQRSMHNNYLTLPVLFVMISNHYPLAFASRFNWLILAIVLVVGAIIRHFYNTRHKGLPSPWWTWGVAAAGVVLIVWLSSVGPSRAERRRSRGSTCGASHLRPGRGGGAGPLQHVPHGRAGLGRHRGTAQARDAGHARAHRRLCRRDLPSGRPHPRHAAGQRHRDHARGAQDPGLVGRGRSAGAGVAVATATSYKSAGHSR
jgi:uncharacterized membrane protein